MKVNQTQREILKCVGSIPPTLLALPAGLYRTPKSNITSQAYKVLNGYNCRIGTVTDRVDGRCIGLLGMLIHSVAAFQLAPNINL